jgi:hypothetical protein
MEIEPSYALPLGRLEVLLLTAEGAERRGPETTWQTGLSFFIDSKTTSLGDKIIGLHKISERLSVSKGLFGQAEADFRERLDANPNDLSVEANFVRDPGGQGRTLERFPNRPNSRPSLVAFGTRGLDSDPLKCVHQVRSCAAW